MLPPWRRAAPEPAELRKASVLVLLYSCGEDLRFPLILRSAGPGPHGGQVALPGGSFEPGESGEQAALRETFEEIGVQPEGVRLLGCLSPLVIEVSRFQVSPFVGWAAHRPLFRAQESEVSSIMEVSVSALLDPASRAYATLGGSLRGDPVPCYRFPGDILVWGATAMILAELSVILSRLL